MPANATNSRVQLCCHGAYRLSPSLGERLSTQNELTRQDTSISQEDRVYLHRCRLPAGLSNRLWAEPDAIGIGTGDTLGEEGPKSTACVEAGTLFLLAADLVPMAPSRPSGSILPSHTARRSAKCFSTSIFLIRLICVLQPFRKILCGLDWIRRGLWVRVNAGFLSWHWLGFQLLHPIRQVPLAGSLAVQRSYRSRLPADYCRSPLR